ncbi:hypothetical protein HAX54_016688 [Datura stramonium]|uniref:Thymidine kinase n=1 Tax=Datura stramonium TaxID=4076 RepID=A0ABS8ULM5_DATST|nr:hypothetical protein [Datura stramonium]
MVKYSNEPENPTKSCKARGSDLRVQFKVDVININEAHFFEDPNDFCCNAADLYVNTVIVAGLDGDCLRFTLMVYVD